MTLSVFDLTGHTQFAVRRGVGKDPEELSLGTFTTTNPGIGGAELPDMTSSDMADWDTALRLAEWIVHVDDEFNNGPHRCRLRLIHDDEGPTAEELRVRPCPFCGCRSAYTALRHTNIFDTEGVRQIRAEVVCEKCGTAVHELAGTFEEARKLALERWEVRA